MTNEHPDEDETVVDGYENRLDELLESTDAEAPAENDDSGRDADDVLFGLDRREFMKAGAATGAVTGLAGCSSLFGPGDQSEGGERQAEAGAGHIVPPGEHDEYYGFWSGGHSGDIRVFGIPSMRELTRIPIFQPESAKGWGHDQKSRDVLQDGQSKDLDAGNKNYWGDVHHPILSESDGDYDGRYLWINEKANGRMARVNLKYFETDAITDIPNMQACHGCSILSPDTKYVFGVGEFRIPIPNDGTTDPSNSDEYWSVFAALNPESMDVEWQIRVSGNMDNADSSKDGRWAFATGYNSEEGFEISPMSRDDRDYMKAFDIPRIEEAIENGEAEDVNGVPVLDCRIDSDLENGSNPPVRYIPTPKSPHGLDVDPTGTYATASGKLSPTVTMVEIDKIDETDEAVSDQAIVGRPNVGLGPLHTTWDDRGHGYTSCFIDSVITKWDVEEAAEAEPGSSAPVKGKIDVHYNPGHVQAVEAETTDPAGDWMVTLNKLSKDRFLPVGPIHPDNDQLINISEDAENATGGMELAADHPVYPEPHDAVYAHRDKIEPNVVWDKEDYAGEKEFVTQEKSRVERTGDQSVHVYTSSVRSNFGLRDFTVRENDEVTLTVTNVESSRDIIHGVAIPRHGINLSIAPQDTREVTFVADDPGIYWIYCTYFCSALHLEMRSRMIVEPRG